MKTFFTEVDSKSDTQIVREINQLLLRINLESPRTQMAMKELGITRMQCQLHNPSDFIHYHTDSKTMYSTHLQSLKETLSSVVNRRREIIGPTVKITLRSPTKSKQFNFLKKIFDHDLKQLYQSELQIKEAQLKNREKIHKQVEGKIKAITTKAHLHNSKVERKLSLLRERRQHELDDRLSKSLDFDSRFEPIQKTLQESKMKFQTMMQSKTQQSLDYHREKKKNIIEQEEMRRTRLQYSMEKSQRSTFMRQGVASQDRLQQAQQLQQIQQYRVIQKIGNQIEKTTLVTLKNQNELQNNLLRFKDEEDRKLNRVQKNISSKTVQQSLRESMINQELQDKLQFSTSKNRQRLEDMQSKIKRITQQKQNKQQELLNRYIVKMEKRNDRIIEKHLKLRENLKRSNKSTQLTQQQQQQIIEKDELHQDISKFQRLVVSKSAQNIQDMLKKLHN